MTKEPKMCEVCGTGPYVDLAAHSRGKPHQKKLAKAMATPIEPAPVPTVLEADLQAIIDRVDDTPQTRARAARLSFGARGWPNAEHPGTVLDFLKEHKIPYV